RLGRPVRGPGQDADHGQRHHLDPGDPAATALRPADVLRVEGAAAPGHPQRPDHRHRPRGVLERGTPMTYDPGSDIVEVQRGPEPGGLGGAYRIFGETLRGLKTSFGRVIEGTTTVEYPEEKTPVYPRF